MPKGVVKTKRDEKDWNTAKGNCTRFRKGKKGGSRYWVCVMGTYKRIRKNRSKGRK